MLHVSKTWSLKRPDLQRLRHNDKAMIRQMCNIKPEDVATVRSNKLLAQLEIDYLTIILRKIRIRRFVHVEQFSCTIKRVCNMQIEGEHGPGRPNTSWMTLTDRERPS